MKLFTYDHCPFCVKARMIFGLKNINFEHVILLNDDEKTPISMIGAKQVPILQKEDNSHMPESMDIVYFIDENYGDLRLVERVKNQEIQDWLAESSNYLYKLCMPRWTKIGLEEFKTQGAIDYFTKKKEAYIGSFAENLAQSNVLILQANGHLEDLEKILEKHLYPKPNNIITESDIHLFAALRSLSCVKGLKYPKLVDDYRKKLADLSKINLHDDIAC